MIEKIRYHTVWKITKSDKNGVYEVMEFEGNLLLNEGIAAWSDGGLTTYTNGATYIGVGDSDTAAAATQTGLQAASNKAWAGMNATYPSRTAQTVTFQATFATDEANFAWNELSIGLADDDSGANLNRKVQAMGTKALGTAWTVDCAITFS
jgi:hypothetical protein